tara:strand:- start:52 stop:228 length:177 start_codon:yes stop_codon:yes gene_type:complete
MAKKHKLELTEPQLRAIIEITNDVSAMIGCGDRDEHWNSYVKLIDRMLKKNGYERQYQ